MISREAFSKPNFKALAARYPWFAEHVIIYGKDKARIDWTNRVAVKELTRVLLLHYFGLVWDMPTDRLCPPVLNRLNYVLWIQELLALCPSQSAAGTRRDVCGIDIGTGSSCIYPLLGVAMHDNW